eukprot:s227_g7.t1
MDQACCDIVSHHFPNVMHRGDVESETAEAIAAAVNQLDPHHEARVLCAAAPPCPDFSVVASSAQGRNGPEGRKFDVYCTLVEKLEPLLQKRQVLHLCENVICSDPKDAEHFSARLHAQPIVADAADFGLINRPRLFWTRIAWTEPNKSPCTNQPLRWSKVNKMPRLQLDVPYQEECELQLPPNMFLHRSVSSHTKRIPCFTTPAPTEDGRPPPKRQRGRVDSEVRERWLADSRQFAPWQYQTHALLHHTDGSTRNLTPCVKEQLHQYPRGYTAVCNADDRARHRMVANSWHVGVVKFLLLLMLPTTVATQVPVPKQPERSTLQFVIDIASLEHHAMGPGRWQHAQPVMPLCHDMWEHWKMSVGAVHPIFHKPHLEPGIHQSFDKLFKWLPDIPRIRQEVVHHVRDLLQDFEGETRLWFNKAPSHVRQVYNYPNQNFFQAPVFLELLRRCGYPAVRDLEDDLQHGFRVIGELHHGPGWLPRTDDRYQHPISFETFKMLNEQHVRRRLSNTQPDKHWQAMLDELLAEKRKGRLAGPFQAPSSWSCQTVPVAGHSLLKLEDEWIGCACSFSVEQTDKIRRIEDWSASYHNSTIAVNDVPTHHGIQHFVESAKHCQQHGLFCLPWGHDLDAAYRQIAVRHPNLCYVLLQTPSGPTLWKHHALSFGATSSVWSFNRLGDALCFLARKLMFIPSLHYVDDFTTIEPAEVALSGFQCFAELFDLLGLHMKAKKAQPPQPSQKLLGVLFCVKPTGISIEPCPQRLERMIQLLDSTLESDRLPPSVAQRMAGKLAFLNTTLFGQVGSAALYLVYARAAQADSSSRNDSRLSFALRDALTCLRALLSHCQPKWVPFVAPTQQVVLYTDAFFELGDRKLSPSEAPLQWSPSGHKNLVNGWGLVARLGSGVVYALGSLPSTLLLKYCTRRAFIYFLEIAAQIIAVVFLRRHLPTYWVSFIDNLAGKAALLKGFGRDLTVNRLLAYAWTLFAKLGFQPHFEWVRSEQNVSDKVSRADESDAERMGWQKLEFDIDPLVAILLRVADDLTYATGQAIDDTLNLPFPAALMLE